MWKRSIDGEETKPHKQDIATSGSIRSETYACVFVAKRTSRRKRTRAEANASKKKIRMLSRGEKSLAGETVNERYDDRHDVSSTPVSDADACRRAGFDGRTRFHASFRMRFLVVSSMRARARARSSTSRTRGHSTRVQPVVSLPPCLDIAFLTSVLHLVDVFLHFILPISFSFFARDTRPSCRWTSRDVGERIFHAGPSFSDLSRFRSRYLAILPSLYLKSRTCRCDIERNVLAFRRGSVHSMTKRLRKNVSKTVSKVCFVTSTSAHPRSSLFSLPIETFDARDVDTTTG